MRTNGQLVEYLMEQSDDIPPAVVPSVEAFEKWPQKTFNFLEKNIRFYDSTHASRDTITESDNVSGNPIQISYVTNIQNFWKYQYWCEFPLQKGKFVDSDECIKKYPRLVQAFLESKLNVVDNWESRMGKFKKMIFKIQ